MRRPDVDRMMASITAREYKEWEAYERAFGPIDFTYEREMLAELHELIQVNNILTGASSTKKGKKNPAGKFKRAPRAHGVFMSSEDDEPDADEDIDDIDDFDEDDYDDDIDDEEEGSHRPSPGEYDPSKDPFA